MAETSAIVTYGPWITSGVIGVGILTTVIIVAFKITFRLGGLFTEVTTVTQAVTDLRAEVAQGNTLVREEVRAGSDRVLIALGNQSPHRYRRQHDFHHTQPIVLCPSITSAHRKETEASVLKTGAYFIPVALHACRSVDL